MEAIGSIHQFYLTLFASGPREMTDLHMLVFLQRQQQSLKILPQYHAAACIPCTLIWHKGESLCLCPHPSAQLLMGWTLQAGPFHFLVCWLEHCCLSIKPKTDQLQKEFSGVLQSSFHMPNTCWQESFLLRSSCWGNSTCSITVCEEFTKGSFTLYICNSCS